VADQKRQLRTLRKQARLQKKLAKKQSGSYLANRLLGGFLLTAFVSLLGLVLATFQTPLLAIERIDFEGNELITTEELQASTSDLMGQPLTTVSETQIESMLRDFTVIESFAIQSRPPNELVIRVRERQPVASVITVLLSLPIGLYREISLVSLNTQDSVELTLRDGTRVIWGDDSEAKLKHEVLQTLIANQTEDVDFDVSAPLAPVVVYRDF
jgi:cell division protein FtsQ